MLRAKILVSLCILGLFALKTVQADTFYAGTSPLTGAGTPDGFTNLLYINEGQPFDFSAASGTEGVATEFNFWAARGVGVVTPFIAEVVTANNFIVRAIGTTREGGTDWNSSGLQQFTFNDDSQPTIQVGWVAGFMSSRPDGSGGGSPIPYTNSNVEGWLTGSMDRVGGPTITLDAPPTTGDFATENDAHGLRRYQFQIGVDVLAVPELPSADFDSDDDVDGNDLMIWEGNFGTTGRNDPVLRALGNANDDGYVDGRDFLIWQQQFGVPIVGAASTTVPEPATGLLFVFAATAAAYLRRR